MPENGSPPNIPKKLPSYLIAIKAKARGTVARSRAILDNCKPDTFLGRKTQAPFPAEDGAKLRPQQASFTWRRWKPIIAGGLREKLAAFFNALAHFTDGRSD